jgi:hypothetical protein
VLQRKRKMAEISSLRRQGHVPGSFADKAQTLLTRGWSKHSWRSRESILRTVDWLLQMERMHLALADRTGPLGKTVRRRFW